MNISIVTYEMDLEGGGLAYSCHQFQKMLMELGHKVKLISSALGGSSYLEGGYDKTLYRTLTFEAKIKIDSQNTPYGTLLIAFGGGFNGYYTSLLAQKTSCRMWLMLRGSDANICKWDLEKLSFTKYAIDKSELVIGLSKEICDNAKNIVPGCKTIIVPNACTCTSTDIKAVTKKKIVIGTGAAHLNEKKGVSTLISMVGLFTAQHPDVKIFLELVGEIDADIFSQYQHQCECLGIKDRVYFLGRKGRESFRQIQSQWDYYVQASVCEGMGNSVVDCMSAGIPVVLTNTGYVAELANRYLPDIVSPSIGAQSLSDTLFNILCDEGIGTRYKSFYDKFFELTSIENIKEQWERILRTKTKKIENKIPEGVLSVSLHDVSGDVHDNITTPIEVFKKFVEDINDAGFSLCSMRDYMSRSSNERSKSIVCTFDDGYTGLLTNALPIMKRYGFTATVYVCTDYIGKNNDWNFKDKQRRTHMNYQELHDLCNVGWEIGSHGVTHRSLLRLNDEEIIYELSKSKHLLDKEFGCTSSYAYPYGDYNEYIMNLVKKFYKNAFLLTQGGVFLEVDTYRIHRYYVSEIYKIIKGL